MKKLFILLLIIANTHSVALADDFVPEGETEVQISADNFILNADNSGNDVILQFGGNLIKYLKWDTSINKFELNDSLNISKDLLVKDSAIVHTTHTYKDSFLTQELQWNLLQTIKTDDPNDKEFATITSGNGWKDTLPLTRWKVGDEANMGQHYGYVGYLPEKNKEFRINTGGDETSLVLGTQAKDFIFIQGNNGNIGIKNNSPENTLDIEEKGQVIEIGNKTSNDIKLNFDDGTDREFGWDDSENSLSTFGNELIFRTRQSTNPPVICNTNSAGIQWMDTDSGILYICDTSNGRNKWLSTDEKVIFGDETGSCSAGANPNSNGNCNVDWGNGLGPDGYTQIGFYIPRDIIITGYGFSEDNDACTSGSFDLEIWGTGSNTNDNDYSLQQEIATGLTGQAHNANDLNIDIDGNQYILWGIDNNCGQNIDDWNMILYFRYKHD